MSLILFCQVLDKFVHGSCWFVTRSDRSCFCNITYYCSWKFSWLTIDFVVFISLITNISSWSIFLNQTQLTPKILQLLHVWLHNRFGDTWTNLRNLICIPLSSKVFSCSSNLLIHFGLSLIEFLQTHSRKMRDCLSRYERFLSFLSRSSLRLLWHRPPFFIQYSWV